MRAIAPLLLALVVGGCAARPRAPAAAPPPVPGPELDALDLHFRALQAGFDREGMAPGALLARGFLPPGGRAAYPVAIAPGECGLFVALGTANMADLDAALYTQEGSPLVEDDSANARPSLMLCAAERPVEAYLTLYAYQGAGSFIAAQLTRPARADDDLHTMHDERGVSPLAQLAQTLHERGFEDAAPRVSLPLGDGRPVRMAMNVAAGECYTLAAEGSEGLAELGLRLVDAEGGELANGLDELGLAALQYCADRRAELALEIVAKRGQGVARVARFRAAQASIGGTRALWLGEPTPSAAAWEQVAKSAPESGSGTSRKLAVTSARVPLHQGQVVELPSRLPPSACTRWEVVLEPGLSRLTLRVESERGALLGEADADHMRACVQVCGSPGPQRVTLLGRAGFGSARLTGTALPAQGSELASSVCSGCTDARTACATSSGLR